MPHTNSTDLDTSTHCLGLALPCLLCLTQGTDWFFCEPSRSCRSSAYYMSYPVNVRETKLVSLTLYREKFNQSCTLPM